MARALSQRFGSDVVLLALGLNVWVSLVLVPSLFVGALPQKPLFTLVAATPLLALAVGAARRSPGWLLLAFPALLLVPTIFDPRIVGGTVHGPVTFGLVAVGLVVYLFGASYLTTLRETPPPERVRRLSSASQPIPARWKRRTRVYALFVAYAIAFPLVLLYAVDFSRSNQTFLKSLYPGRSGSMTLLLNLGVLLLWLALFAAYFLSPLKKHRTGDRDLERALDRMRDRARKGAPRPIFYFAVVGALVFMGLLIHLRYR